MGRQTLSKNKRRGNEKSCARGIKISTKGKNLRYLGCASLAVLGIVGVGAIYPVSLGSADAMENTERSVASRVTVDAAAMISISLDPEVTIDITPDATGQFSYNKATLGVTTNNPEGYSLYMTTADGKKTLNSTRNINDPGINSITSDTVGSDFTGNTWGYALETGAVSESTTYKEIPDNNSAAIHVSNDATTVQDVFNLGFGAHVDTSLAAGSYTNEVIVSAVANPRTISGLSDLVYMQDMTPTICANTPEETTKKVYDVRDGKPYYVAKMKDGNCWMTQNLDYDLKAGQVLSSNDTDIQGSWTVPSDTEQGIPAKETADYTSAKSWDLGQVVLTNPTGSSLCSTPLPDNLKDQGYTNIDGSNNYNSAWHGQNLTETCSQWYKDVSALTPGFDATETSSLSEDGTQYDAHYLIGNYYQWGAVTAGTGAATDADNTTTDGLTDESKLQDAAGSICPKGWKLPTSGGYSSGENAWPYARDDSFYNLLRAYGYPETGSNGPAETGWVANGGYPYTSITGASKTRLDYQPLYFVRSGYTNLTTGSLRFTGLDGFYWSSTAYPNSSTTTYRLDFNITNIYPSHHGDRYIGFSARCVAR